MASRANRDEEGRGDSGAPSADPEMGDCPRLSGGPQLITNVLERGGESQKIVRKRTARDRRPDAAGFEHEGKGHKPRIADASRSWKSKEIVVPSSFQRQRSPAETSVLAQ